MILPKLLTSTLAFSFLASLAMAEKVVVGYFPNWLYDKFPVSSIDFSVYTHVHYAFAIMVGGNVPTWSDPAVIETGLSELVAAAHAAKSKALISVGGWTGSMSFSSMAASASSRKEFIDWNIAQIKHFNTDGVDIDWEYPGRQGAGCNELDAANDVKNLYLLLKEMRAALDKSFKTHKELSIAGYVEAFNKELTGSDSKTLTASIGKLLDRVNIMTYDINGAWNPKTGANAPLDAPNNGFSFNAAIDLWIAAGVPAEKLAGGLGFYGRSTTATTDMTKSKSLYQDQLPAVPQGDSEDALWADPNCVVDKATGAKIKPSLSGIWKFGNLISQGILDTPTTAKAPWIRTFDKESSTPWLFNPSTKTFISYDDPISIAAKVKSAKKKGAAGVMIWAINQDSEAQDLLKVVKKFNT